MKKQISLLFFVLLSAPILLSAQSTNLGSQASSSCLSLINNLQYKSTDILTNNEVTALQKYLQTKGYLNTNPVGYFGLLTTSAVKKFQVSNGINATGYVGPLTRAKIKNLTCTTSVNTTSTATVTTPSTTITNNSSTVAISNTILSRNLDIGSQGSDVLLLKKFLISKGYLNVSLASDVLDQYTKNAVAQYQTSMGILPADGSIGPITRANINSSLVSSPIVVNSTSNSTQTQPSITGLGTNNANPGDMVAVYISGFSQDRNYYSFYVKIKNQSIEKTITAGASSDGTYVSFAIPSDMASGTYDISVGVYGTAVISQNSLPMVISVPIVNTSAKSDLTISNVNCTPSVPKSTDTVSCVVSVYNNSSVDINKSFNVYLASTSTSPVTKSIDSLKAQETKSVTFDQLGFPGSSGFETLPFWTNIPDQVGESSINNNSFNKNLNITVVATVPNYDPRANIDSYSPTSGVVNKEIVFTGGFEAMGNGYAMTTIWSYGDGTIDSHDNPVGATSGGASGHHTYTQAGTYTVTLTLKTSNGKVVTSSPVTVIVN